MGAHGSNSSKGVEVRRLPYGFLGYLFESAAGTRHFSSLPSSVGLATKCSANARCACVAIPGRLQLPVRERTLSAAGFARSVGKSLEVLGCPPDLHDRNVNHVVMF